ncbi:MAG TPA: T9SS type A sorting domain-containing protein [Ignavibacteria bacterium]|nr:T9SS type A sorting domain-containing protein [Ignavibacteria bacterium]HMR39696.1 T9SS type A sorting domain-containing protein [Ignavibacteria bacterium]
MRGVYGVCGIGHFKITNNLLILALKKIALIFFLLISARTEIYSQEYWLTQNSPTTRDLTSVYFTDSLNGWIGGDSGYVIHTTDKGKSWISQNTGVNNSIHSLFFLNDLIGFALSFEFDNTPPAYFGTRILTTSDGGNTWNNSLFPDSNIFLSTIFFLDSLKGFTGGSNGIIYYTTNTGATWLESVIDSGFAFGFPIIDIEFYDEDIGFASGGSFDIAGQMFKTTDGGLNWRSRIVGPEPVLDLHVADSLNIYCAGGDFEYGASIVTTTNSGANWVYNELGVFGISNAIGYRTQNEIWVSMNLIDSFLISTDGGFNWNLTATPDNSIISDMTFADKRNGWAVGKDGVILKYNSSLINIFNNEIHSPDNYALYQNYPNPFNPDTRISYKLRITSYVSLKVYDVLGNEIADLVNENKPAGSYKVEFSGSGLSSGIYFYSLYVNGVLVDTKSMMLLK